MAGLHLFVIPAKRKASKTGIAASGDPRFYGDEKGSGDEERLSRTRSA
jgi:hypothetical protein